MVPLDPIQSAHLGVPAFLAVLGAFRFCGRRHRAAPSAIRRAAFCLGRLLRRSVLRRPGTAQRTERVGPPSGSLTVRPFHAFTEFSPSGARVLPRAFPRVHLCASRPEARHRPSPRDDAGPPASRGDERAAPARSRTLEARRAAPARGPGPTAHLGAGRPRGSPRGAQRLQRPLARGRACRSDAVRAPHGAGERGGFPGGAAPVCSAGGAGPRAAPPARRRG
nr:hypothetical protein MOAAAGMB_00001 [Gallid alphaherpesvirus 2]